MCSGMIRPCSLKSRLRGLHRDLGPGDLVALSATLRRVSEHRGDTPAVLPLQVRERSETLLDRLEPPWLLVEPLAEVADLTQQIRRLDLERSRARGQRRGFAIKARCAVKGRGCGAKAAQSSPVLIGERLLSVPCRRPQALQVS